MTVTFEVTVTFLGKVDTVYQLWYTVCMDNHKGEDPTLHVVFYKTESGKEPVREWLKDLPKEDKKIIGEDIKTAQYGWPIGMPLIRKIEKDLWEVRSHVSSGIARVFFTVKGVVMILLHGFIKKSNKIPQNELDTARRRLKNVEKE